MRAQVGNVTVECVQGDITDQPDVDAVVNAANAQLAPGGGVAGARFVLFGERDLRVHEEVLERLGSATSDG